MAGVRISDDGSSIYNGMTVNTPFENEKDKGVKVEDFLNLMVAQMSNQDFMNPTDDTQYISQMAQFASMQAMQELSHYSQTGYVTGLVGKTVTVASLSLGGSVSKDVGQVTSVDLSGDEYMVTVNGKQYTLSQIMNIADTESAVTPNDLEAANKLVPIVQKTTGTSIKLRWDSPLTDASLSDELRYDVYYTTDDSKDFSSLESVKSGTKAASNLSDPEFEIDGLQPGQRYYINVVVRNARGDEAVYQRAAQTTSN